MTTTDVYLRGPAVTHPPAPTGWAVRPKNGTGLFVVSELHGTMLFRFDPTAMTMYCYDKKAKLEIAVPLHALVSMAGYAIQKQEARAVTITSTGIEVG